MSVERFGDAAHQHHLPQLIKDATVQQHRSVEVGQRTDSQKANLAGIAVRKLHNFAGAFSTGVLPLPGAGIERDFAAESGLLQQQPGAFIHLLGGAVAKGAAEGQHLRPAAVAQQVQKRQRVVHRVALYPDSVVTVKDDLLHRQSPFHHSFFTITYPFPLVQPARRLKFL